MHGMASWGGGSLPVVGFAREVLAGLNLRGGLWAGGLVSRARARAWCTHHTRGSIRGGTVAPSSRMPNIRSWVAADGLSESLGSRPS